MDKRIKQSFQVGGIARTKQQQQVGLNNDTYNSMSFPGSGNRMFRGLDSGAPVYIKDQSGKQKVLRGPQDTDQFYGHVQEQRMQQGGRALIYVSDLHDPRLQAYNDSLDAYKSGKVLASGLQKTFEQIADGRSYAKDYSDLYNNPSKKPEFGNADKWRTGEDYNKWYSSAMHTNENAGNSGIKTAISENTNRIDKIGKLKVQPQYIGSSAELVEFPIYKKPIQPIQYRHEQENIQSLPYTGISTDIPQQQLQQREIPYDNTQPMYDGSNRMLQYEREHPDDKLYQGKGFKFGGNLNNNTMAKRKDFQIPGFKYGGNQLGGAAIIPHNNPYGGTGTDFVPVEYRRATNGMMENGGYLDFISYPEAPNTYQHGGTTTDYRPSNQNNTSVQFVNDKPGYSNMQTPGYHYTNDGFKKSTGSNMNGASWSKFGGEINNQFMPAPLEYAMLQNGGHYSRDGGSINGQIMYDTDEMKEGGIHIKNRPFYKDGGVVEGEYDIDEPLTMDEIKHLKSQGYDIHY